MRESEKVSVTLATTAVIGRLLGYSFFFLMLLLFKCLCLDRHFGAGPSRSTLREEY